MRLHKCSSYESLYSEFLNTCNQWSITLGTGNTKERMGAKGDCGSFNRHLPSSRKSRQQSYPFYSFAINPMLINLVKMCWLSNSFRTIFPVLPEPQSALPHPMHA